MKEDKKKKEAGNAGKKQTKTAVGQSWLSEFVESLNGPEDNIQKGRERLLKEIKGQKNSKSFEENQKIQQANEKIKNKSFLSSLLSPESDNESLQLESEVNDLSAVEIDKKENIKQEKKHLNFTSHSEDVNNEQVDVVASVEDGKIKNEQDRLVETLFKRDDSRHYDKVDSYHERKHGWKLFSLFSKNNDTKVTPHQESSPEFEKSVSKDRILSVFKETAPVVIKNHTEDVVDVTANQKKITNNSYSSLPVVEGENVQKIEIKTPKKNTWKLFSPFTKKDKIVNSLKVDNKNTGTPIEDLVKIKFDQPIIDNEDGIHKPEHQVKTDLIAESGTIDNKDKDDDFSWENPEILKSNLIKEDMVIFFDWKKNIIVMFIFIGFLLLGIATAYWGLSYEYNRKKTELANWQSVGGMYNQEIESKTDSMKETMAFKTRLSLTSRLLNQHIYWTNLFNFLEEYSIPDVYYSSFSGDNEGKYTITATAKRYNDISNLVTVLRESDKVVSVSVVEGRTGKTGIDFELRLVVRTDIFYKKNE